MPPHVPVDLFSAIVYTATDAFELPDEDGVLRRAKIRINLITRDRVNSKFRAYVLFSPIRYKVKDIQEMKRLAEEDVPAKELKKTPVIAMKNEEIDIFVNGKDFAPVTPCKGKTHTVCNDNGVTFKEIRGASRNGQNEFHTLVSNIYNYEALCAKLLEYKSQTTNNKHIWILFEDNSYPMSLMFDVLDVEIKRNEFIGDDPSKINHICESHFFVPKYSLVNVLFNP
jgi:hypothetical protein